MSQSASATSPALSSTPLADRDALVEKYRQARQRSSSIFDLVPPDGRLERPISLRHPIIFYEGHIPAFYVNTIVKKGLGAPGIDPSLERLFARGIDPDSETSAHARTIQQWPSREELSAYVAETDRLVEQTLRTADLDQPANPVMRGGQAVWACLEHEAMHQETLLYILHRLPFDRKRRPAGAVPASAGNPAPDRLTYVRVPAGTAVLGANARVPFGWDNEYREHAVSVPAFRISRRKVTNADWLEFVEAGSYADQSLWTPDDWKWVVTSKIVSPPFWMRQGSDWHWHGMFEDVPLPLAWPVYVTQAEASAFARWKGGRLPREAEYHRAAFGTPVGEERLFPWGDAPPDGSHGNFDFAAWDPSPVGAHSAGASAFGLDEPIGNGWEWTSTVFEPFPGFEPMASYPEYSADFFDGQHYVMKGASPVTGRELIRRSFRNWFRPQYPYVYAGFRVVHEA